MTGLPGPAAGCRPGSMDRDRPRDTAQEAWLALLDPSLDTGSLHQSGLHSRPSGSLSRDALSRLFPLYDARNDLLVTPT